MPCQMVPADSFKACNSSEAVSEKIGLSLVLRLTEILTTSSGMPVEGNLPKIATTTTIISVIEIIRQ